MSILHAHQNKNKAVSIIEHLLQIGFQLKKTWRKGKNYQDFKTLYGLLWLILDEIMPQNVISDPNSIE